MRKIKGVTIETMILAKEFGIRFPEHHKKSKVDADLEMYDAGIYYFKKPKDSFDVSYLTYWNGKKFRGGYIIYENNYSMPGKGVELPENGITLYPDDTKEIRNILKKARQYNDSEDSPGLIKGWYKFNFALYSDELHFWGIETLDIFSISGQEMSCIECIMDKPYLEIIDLFDSEEKNRKPKEKYVASLPGFCKNLNINEYDGHVISHGDTVSQAWKRLYRKIENEDSIYHFYLNIDEYHRACHYKFKISVDNVTPADKENL
jgi:hypothetical protein